MQLRDMFARRIGESQGEVVDILKLVSCASLKLIARGVLGHSFGNLEDDAPFRHAVKNLMLVSLFSLIPAHSSKTLFSL
jgi:hypothetical protein